MEFRARPPRIHPVGREQLHPLTIRPSTSPNHSTVRGHHVPARPGAADRVHPVRIRNEPAARPVQQPNGLVAARGPPATRSFVYVAVACVIHQAERSRAADI